MIKASSGPCHKDPGNPVNIAEISIIYCPSPTSPHKIRPKSISEKDYFFCELVYLLLGWLLSKRINHKRNSLFQN